MTLFDLATTPWSHDAISAVVIYAIATAIASPLVEINTISSPTLILSSNLKTPGTINFAPKHIALIVESFTTTLLNVVSKSSRGNMTCLKYFSSLYFSYLY